MVLRSLRLGLIGKADVVEFHRLFVRVFLDSNVLIGTVSTAGSARSLPDPASAHAVPVNAGQVVRPRPVGSGIGAVVGLELAM